MGRMGLMSRICPIGPIFFALVRGQNTKKAMPFEHRLFEKPIETDYRLENWKRLRAPG